MVRKRNQSYDTFFHLCEHWIADVFWCQVNSDSLGWSFLQRSTKLKELHKLRMESINCCFCSVDRPLVCLLVLNNNSSRLLLWCSRRQTLAGHKQWRMRWFKHVYKPSLLLCADRRTILPKKLESKPVIHWAFTLGITITLINNIRECIYLYTNTCTLTYIRLPKRAFGGSVEGEYNSSGALS